MTSVNELEEGTDLRLDFDALELALTSGEPQKAVRADFESGVRSGVSGTPTFFVNGQRLEVDWRDADIFARALEDIELPGHRRRAS